jgi:Helix-turn-helix domain
MKPLSQQAMILNALKAGETITPLDALHKFGCMRISARVYDLRHKGFLIENIGTDDGQYACYKLKYAAPVPVMPPAFPSKPAENNQQLF